MAVVLTERIKTELMNCHDIVATGRYPYTGRLGILAKRDEELVEEAMEAVHAQELGSRDFNAISEGQRQRVLLARAICQEPEILILDDSSSALDFATDAKLRKAVHNLEGNTTTFLVSQRIAGIRQADQILVLGNGTLEGNGTHDELMKTCEVYREIYFSQFPEERAAYNNESGVIA